MPRPSARRLRVRPSSGVDHDRVAPAHRRFQDLPEDRAVREWGRYEGTAQRELFRELRERFLARHAVPGGWAIDVGSGPGRFTPFVGGAEARRIAFDLSRNMLTVGRGLERRGHGDARTAWVRGDALRPPFSPAAFGEVAAVGNALGFEVDQGPELLELLEGLVRPGGRLVLEIAPGPGERSVYLQRLPAAAVGRLVASPPALVAARVRREPFAREPRRHRTGAFRRWTVATLAERWAARGWVRRETMAVAPALGADAERLDAVARESTRWDRLLQLEEIVGRDPARWAQGAAVLLAVERRSEQSQAN